MASSYSLRVLHVRDSHALVAELERIGAEPSLQNDQTAKSSSLVIKLERIPFNLALFLYQEMLLEGGEVVVPARMADRTSGETDILLLGTRYQLQHLAVRLRTQTEGTPGAQDELGLLADDLVQAMARSDHPSPGGLTVRNTTFDWGKRTFVMGILNVTPDSFSGDGIYQTTQGPGSSDENVVRAVARAQELVKQGADILDVGGESTRPGSVPTPADEEQRRVIPVIRALRQQIDVPISIDTYRAETARLALDAGADIVNDVWGLRMDPEMKHQVARRGVPVVIMHNRSKPKDASQSERLGGRYVGVQYVDLMADVIRELRDQIDLAVDAGIAPDKIIVDPGIGFGKTVPQNVELLDRLGELRVLGLPILLGPSRKGFIGYTLDLPPDQRAEGTAATIVLGIERGADIVRVHDVSQIVRVARMTDAIVRR